MPHSQLTLHGLPRHHPRLAHDFFFVYGTRPDPDVKVLGTLSSAQGQAIHGKSVTVPHGDPEWAWWWILRFDGLKKETPYDLAVFALGHRDVVSRTDIQYTPSNPPAPVAIDHPLAAADGHKIWTPRFASWGVHNWGDSAMITARLVVQRKALGLTPPAPFC